MTDTQQDYGGPAFPRGPVSGMILWDYYAAAALQGLLSLECLADMRAVDVARLAAALADAMIAKRNQRGIGT